MQLESLSRRVFRDDKGVPIARGQMFIAQENTNNLVYVFLDSQGKFSTKDYPLQLSNEGTTNIWLPRDRAFHVTVKNEWGSLVLYENQSFKVDDSGETLTTVVTTFGGNKALTYTLGTLTQVDTFTDSTRSKLSERKVLDYDLNGRLTTIRKYDGAGALLVIRTFEYTGDLLTGITES